jgi:hypothetical protein
MRVRVDLAGPHGVADVTYPPFNGGFATSAAAISYPSASPSWTDRDSDRCRCHASQYALPADDVDVLGWRSEHDPDVGCGNDVSSLSSPHLPAVRPHAGDTASATTNCAAVARSSRSTTQPAHSLRHRRAVWGCAVRVQRLVNGRWSPKCRMISRQAAQRVGAGGARRSPNAALPDHQRAPPGAGIRERPVAYSHTLHRYRHGTDRWPCLAAAPGLTTPTPAGCSAQRRPAGKSHRRGTASNEASPIAHRLRHHDAGPGSVRPDYHMPLPAQHGGVTLATHTTRPPAARRSRSPCLRAACRPA